MKTFKELLIEELLKDEWVYNDLKKVRFWTNLTYKISTAHYRTTELISVNLKYNDV